jgi:hypothetical protein
MAGKKNFNKKNSKVVSKKQVEKIARQVAYKQMPKKLFATQGMDVTVQTNGNSWLLIEPTAIDYGTANYNRASDEIYVEKCKGFFNVSFGPATTNRVEVRELCGFYKGSTNPQDKNIAEFNASRLQTHLQNKMARWDRDNYHIVRDKSYDLMPQQVYNAGPGNGNNVPNGIWRSKRIPLSLHMYRKYRFTSGTAGSTNGNTTEGAPASSNHVTGWKPFIALQIRCPDQDFTGGSGNNPGPYVDYEFVTEFKDLQ